MATRFVCQSCEYQTPNWLGQCPKCLEWNTLVETEVLISKSSTRGGGSFGSKGFSGSSGKKPILLSDVKATDTKRVSSGSREFDRVLGGGFVPGQVVLLAGDPGVGKSTLLTQVAKNMPSKRILYICGEESVSQVKVRANRMGYDGKNLLVVSETDTEAIAFLIESEASKIGLVIVDSIQTLTSQDFVGTAGSVGQIKSGTQKLSYCAKTTHTPLILVGHVTKEGSVAGPKVLEHIVDTVLYLEGDAQHMFRILKTTKNRFGAVSETGIFEMIEEGMREVDNPSELFLSERLKSESGSCVTVVMEGYRPILFEIQALTSKTSFGYPRRTSTGFNVNRLQVLIAVLEKHCGLDLSQHDVYINVAGGFKVAEYASDLAVCSAIASSLKNKPVSGKTVAFGEVGLSGEIRRVTYEDKRVKEAKKLGYTNVVSPLKTKSVRDALKQILTA
ncbi:DNA repair protein RadA [candidate division WWE3 bacterium]|nr:DNA repair protein RadA [candidate division WWE3 bacterium]